MAKLFISILFATCIGFSDDSPFTKSIVEQVGTFLSKMNHRECNCNDTPLKKINVDTKQTVKKKDDKNSRPLVAFDGVFLFDANYSNKSLQLTGTGFNDLIGSNKLSNAEYLQTYQLFMASIGKDFFYDSPYKAAQSFKESKQLVMSQAPNLSFYQKIMFLSLMGAETESNYSHDMVKSGLRVLPYEQIWQANRNTTSGAGTCGNISPFLSEYAKALGEEVTAIDSGLWARQGQANKASGHVIYQFRDPTTGDYYIQNYSSIINTHQKTEQGARDVSERILGPITSSMMVESSRADGSSRTHQYVPRTSRWVNEMLQQASRLREEKATVQMTVSNHEQTFIGGYQPTIKFPAKGFLINSNYTSTDGEKISYVAAGVSSQQQIGTKEKKAIFDQMNFSAHEMFGVSQISTPVIDPESQAKQNNRQNLFAGLDLKGSARVNKTTGKVEISAIQNDFRGMDTGIANASAPAHDISAGLEYKATDHITIDGTRHWELGVDNLSNQKIKVQTAYDAIDVIYDTRSNDKKAYLVIDSKLYLMEGVENLSAIGLKEKLKLAIPTEKRGTFTVMGEAEGMVNNRSRDAFYNTPASSDVSATWEKIIQHSVKVGASATLATKDQPFYLFEDRSAVRPDLGSRNSTNAQVYMQISWGK